MRIGRDRRLFICLSKYDDNVSEMLQVLCDEDKNLDKPPAKDFDNIWKLMIEHMFKYFFPFFFPCDAAEYDLSHIEFLDRDPDKIYPEKDHRPPRLIVDKLVKIFKKHDPESFSLFHNEVQGFANRRFPHRMYEYGYRLCAKFNCPIISLAIITGNQKASGPRYFNAICGATIKYHYPVYQVNHRSEEELLNDSNLFPCLILAA